MHAHTHAHTHNSNEQYVDMTRHLVKKDQTFFEIFRAALEKEVVPDNWKLKFVPIWTQKSHNLCKQKKIVNCSIDSGSRESLWRSNLVAPKRKHFFWHIANDKLTEPLAAILVWICSWSETGIESFLFPSCYVCNLRRSIKYMEYRQTYLVLFTRKFLQRVWKNFRGR